MWNSSDINNCLANSIPALPARLTISILFFHQHFYVIGLLYSTVICERLGHTSQPLSLTWGIRPSDATLLLNGYLVVQIDRFDRFNNVVKTAVFKYVWGTDGWRRECRDVP